MNAPVLAHPTSNKGVRIDEVFHNNLVYNFVNVFFEMGVNDVHPNHVFDFTIIQWVSHLSVTSADTVRSQRYRSHLGSWVRGKNEGSMNMKGTRGEHDREGNVSGGSVRDGWRQRCQSIKLSSTKQTLVNQTNSFQSNKFKITDRAKTKSPTTPKQDQEPL